MKPEPRDIDELLGDIVEWGNRVTTYVGGLSLEEFVADTLKQDAAIRCLEVMGEAAGNILRIDPAFQEAHPDLALREAYRARNRTAHGYGSVDLSAIWQSANGPVQDMLRATQIVLAARQRST